MLGKMNTQWYRLAGMRLSLTVIGFLRLLAMFGNGHEVCGGRVYVRWISNILIEQMTAEKI